MTKVYPHSPALQIEIFPISLIDIIAILREKGAPDRAFKFDTSTDFLDEEQMTIRNVEKFLREVKSKTKYQVELPDEPSVALSKEKTD